MKNIILAICLLAFSTGTMGQAAVEIEGDFLINGAITVTDSIIAMGNPIEPDDAIKKEYVDSFLINIGIALGRTGLQTLLSSGYAPADILPFGVMTSEFHGLNYAGGIIFYLESNGKGLVVADENIATMYGGIIDWGCENELVATSSGGIFQGESDNVLILNHGCTEPNIPVEMCSQLVKNGYDDWYLPSADELEQIFQKLVPLSVGNLIVSHVYWSSTETDATLAKALRFNNNTSPGNYPKDQIVGRVRAIRTFLP